MIADTLCTLLEPPEQFTANEGQFIAPHKQSNPSSKGVESKFDKTTEPALAIGLGMEVECLTPTDGFVVNIADCCRCPRPRYTMQMQEKLLFKVSMQNEVPSMYIPNPFVHAATRYVRQA